jgi:Putative sensor
VFAERVRVARSWQARAGARAAAARQAISRLAAGLGTAVLAGGALVLVLVTLAACLAGVGLFLVPAALRAVRAAADRERARLSRWGPECWARNRYRPAPEPPFVTPPSAGNWPGCRATRFSGCCLACWRFASPS